MKSVKGIVYALISSSTFGLIPLFALPIIQSGLGSPSILFYRFAFAALALGLLMLFSGKSFRIGLKDLGILTVLGFLYAATSMGLLFSYSMIPSGMATTIHFLYPILVTLIMVIFFKESKSIWLFIAAAMSLTGVGLLSWSNGGASFQGILTVLLTVITYGVYIVGVNKSGISKLDTLPLTFYVLAVGAVMFAVYAFSTTGIEAIPDSHTWFNVLLLAILPTVISDLTLVLAVKYAGSTTTSILGSMEPLTAVLVGVLYFAEPFNGRGLLGIVMVIVSVVLVILGNTRRRTSEQ